jgi:hypothetical protein
LWKNSDSGPECGWETVNGNSLDPATGKDNGNQAKIDASVSTNFKLVDDDLVESPGRTRASVPPGTHLAWAIQYRNLLLNFGRISADILSTEM